VIVTSVSSAENKVRVAVLNDAQGFGLSVRGTYRVTDPTTHQELDRGRRLKKCDVSLSRDGIKVGLKEYAVSHLQIIAAKDVEITTQGKKKRYRKQIDIIRTKANHFLVVNTLDLESYVKGVLYHEVSHRWPLNAIKAQAVATRTYALYQVKQNKELTFDVTSDIYSQVYGGKSAERYRPSIAANRTRGQILTFQGNVLPAYFHSNCGGHTEDAKELWEHDFPPLSGVQCGFCTNKPNYQWKKNFQSKDIQDKLNRAGIKIGLIKDISAVGRTKTGRVKNLKITSRDGKTVALSGAKFRDIVGPNILKSNYYTIDMKGYYFDVSGLGWGHGVGMCQWGAYQMSKERHTYTRILAYYYPGTQITKISEL